MCSQASALPELAGPTTALTFSLSISSVMFWIDFGGEPRLSRFTPTSLRPITPPALLMSSMAASKPQRPAVPSSATPLADWSAL